MKVSRLETHDRLEHFIKDQSISISEGAQDCLKKNELSIALQEQSPYIYIFAHPRTADDGVNKVMYWQPRLTKPLAQTNSYLFRAKSKTDILEVFWLLPPEEMWGQYKKGNVTEHEYVIWSIDQYKNNRHALQQPEPDDLPEDVGVKIWMKVIGEMREERTRKKLFKPMILEQSSEIFLPQIY